MEARDYLKRAVKICEKYDPKGCKDCPLKELCCGFPSSDEDIERVVEVVGRYKEETEQVLKPCPYCGGEGKVKESPVFRNTGPDSTKHTIGKAYSVRCTVCGGGTKSYDKEVEAKRRGIKGGTNESI